MTSISLCHNGDYKKDRFLPEAFVLIHYESAQPNHQ